jgi:hypothetical protein
MLAQFAKNFETAAAAVQPVAAPDVAASPEAVAFAVAPPAEALSAVTPSRPPAAAPANELNALSLAWIVVRGWFLGLFGKKTA